MNKTYKVLSIDAWGNQEDGYEWNSWHNAGTIELVSIEDDDLILREMQWQGFITDSQAADIEDDQWNLVIVDKATREPVFAIEYGSTI
jgi:hypothetical protein